MKSHLERKTVALSHTFCPIRKVAAVDGVFVVIKQKERETGSTVKENPESGWEKN